ncbi:MAG: 50S ribosomal protein L35 [Spirochaetia bacterium]|nr:50S ribosomal protein L35 [Spirochaetia bacterium]
MPKIKTNRSAMKRFSMTKNGKIKRANANRNHILTKKTRKRKLKLKQGSYVHPANAENIKRLIGY